MSQVIYVCMPCFDPINQVDLPPPPEQKDCIKEACPECKKDMWVSEKKRGIRLKNPKITFVCGVCAVLKTAGAEIEFMDITAIH